MAVPPGPPQTKAPGAQAPDTAIEGAKPGNHQVVGRIVRSADFVRILRTPIRARSAHFALHHLLDVPGSPAKPSSKAAQAASPTKLSTGAALQSSEPVDDCVPRGVWLGTVVPKRHAKRAVTRTMIKRQIKAAIRTGANALSGGLWVVRLRAPFDRTEFPSANSHALAAVVSGELQAMFRKAL